MNTRKKKPRVKFCLTEQTCNAFYTLCELYGFRPSAMVTHLIHSAPRPIRNNAA